MDYILLNTMEELAGDFPRTYVRFPMPKVSAEAMHFLQKLREKWANHPNSRIREFPIGTIDIEGRHGADCPGFILTESLGETRIEERFRYNVVARCSFGVERPYEDKDVKFFAYNLEEFNRFHISIHADREFVAEDDDRSDNKTVYHWSEAVNVSLRWDEGEFQVFWNDSSRKQVNGKRATYLASKKGYGCGDGSDAMLKGVVRRQKASEKEALLGYEDVLAYLSRFGNISPQDTETISKMSFIEGLDFLIDQVMPCALQFAKH